MRGTPYLSADTLDDIRNAYGCGVPLETLAAQVGTSENDLQRLLGLPQWNAGPIQGDLFADQPDPSASISER